MVAAGLPGAAGVHAARASRRSAAHGRGVAAIRQQTLKGSPIMINMRMLAIVALGLVLSTSSLHGQDRSRYRAFQLGSGLSSISGLTGVAASKAKTIHSRPALMQELQWQ